MGLTSTELCTACRAVLDEKRCQELNCDLQKRFAESEGALGYWLRSIVPGLLAAAEASAAASPASAAVVVNAVQPSRNLYAYSGQRQVDVQYEYKSTSTSFGMWTAQVLSKSAQGEDGKRPAD